MPYTCPACGDNDTPRTSTQGRGRMTWWGDFEEDDTEDTPTEPASPEVDISDPRIIAELLGPDGEPLAFLLDRPAVPFGYQPGAA